MVCGSILSLRCWCCGCLGSHSCSRERAVFHAHHAWCSLARHSTTSAPTRYQSRHFAKFRKVGAIVTAAAHRWTKNSLLSTCKRTAALYLMR